MKEEMEENLLIYLLCIAVVVITIAIILNIVFLNQIPKQYLSEKTDLSENLNCSERNIFKTSYCLEDELSEFYNYNLSNVGKYLNLSQLKESGGVCRHYANWYKDNFLKLGAKETDLNNYYKEETTSYYISELIFPTDNKTAHVVTIVSNNEGYCVLDQLDVKCWKLK